MDWHARRSLQRRRRHYGCRLHALNRTPVRFSLHAAVCVNGRRADCWRLVARIKRTSFLHRSTGRANVHSTHRQPLFHVPMECLAGVHCNIGTFCTAHLVKRCKKYIYCDVFRIAYRFLSRNETRRNSFTEFLRKLHSVDVAPSIGCEIKFSICNHCFFCSGRVATCVLALSLVISLGLYKGRSCSSEGSVVLLQSCFYPSSSCRALKVLATSSRFYEQLSRIVFD